MRGMPLGLVVAAVLTAVSAACDATGPPSAAAPPPGARGQLYPPDQLGALDPPDRAQWQLPELVMDALNIADGSHVADVGAGGGWFTSYLARRVGPNGVVYAAGAFAFSVAGLSSAAGGPAAVAVVATEAVTASMAGVVLSTQPE